MTNPMHMVGFSSKRVVDVGYAIQSSPIGDLTVVEGPRGILLIEFRRQLPEVFGPRIEQALGVPVRVMRRRLDTCRELDEYFHGERRHFTVPADLSLMSGFRREVLEILTRRSVRRRDLVRRARAPCRSATRRARGGRSDAIESDSDRRPLPSRCRC